MSQSSRLSRLSTTTRGSKPYKKSRYSTKSTTGDRALSRVRKARNSNIVAFPYRQPFPAQLVTTLKYVDYITIACNTSGYGVTQISCNSLYDPDSTLVGHQPMYFDQLMTIYNHYAVLKSKCSYTIAAGQTTVSTPVDHTIYIDDDTTYSIPAAYVGQERTGAVTKTFIPSGDGAAFGKVTKYWSSGFTFPGDALSRDELQGTVSASPAEQSHFTLLVNGGTNFVSFNYTIRVEVEYTAVFDEWKSVAAS